MANNCLVKKLKGTVDNNNLEYLNGIEINIKPVAGYADSCHLIFQYVRNKPFDVICKDKGNHLSLASNLSNPQSKITVPVTDSQFYIYLDKSVEYTIVLKCQYNSVGYFRFYGKCVNVSVEDFKHIKGLLGLVLTDLHSYGNLSALNNLSLLKSFYGRGYQAYYRGTLSAFYSSTNLETLIFGSGGVAGEIIDLADALVAGGRTTGTLTIQCNGFITLDGVVPAYGTTKTITFDSSLPDGYSIA